MSSLGANTHGRTYDYDSPYFPQYRPARITERYLAGRRWVQVTELSPWTRYRDGRMVITQGRRVTTWTYAPDGTMAHATHTVREINAPRHPHHSG